MLTTVLLLVVLSLIVLGAANAATVLGRVALGLALAALVVLLWGLGSHRLVLAHEPAPRALAQAQA